jgi:hypothetical protein
VKTENGIRAVHLTDDDLIALAVPSGATPEPLPAHLSECLDCSRALAEWKGALMDIGAADEEALARRPPEEQRTCKRPDLLPVSPGRD